MRARLLLFIAIVSAVGSACVAVALNLIAFKVWTVDDTWKKVALSVGSALFAVGPALVGAVRRYRAPRLEHRREVTGLLCRTLYWRLPAITGIDALDLGVAAYRLERRRWPRKPRLKRLYRERARHRNSTSGVRWAPGKGVMGLAVARQSFVGLDVDSAWAGLHDCTKQVWQSQDETVRQGLSYDEFKKLVGKHGAVAAMPIFDDRGDGQVVGCVAVDGPAGTADALTSLEVQEALGDTAVALYNGVFNPPH